MQAVFVGMASGRGGMMNIIIKLCNVYINEFYIYMCKKHMNKSDMHCLKAKKWLCKVKKDFIRSRNDG